MEKGEEKSMAVGVERMVHVGHMHNERAFITIRAVMDAGVTVFLHERKTPYKAFSEQRDEEER